MTWQNNPYGLLLLVATFPVLGLLVITWRFRRRRAAFFFILFTLAVSGFTLSYGLELLSPSLTQMMMFLRLEYIFSLSLPVLYLMFVLAYCGYETWLTRSNVGFLFLIPVIHLLTVWTNEYHHLNWATVGVEVVDGFAMFSRTYGSIFWIGTIYLYMIAAIATGILVVSIGRYPMLYRSQIIPLLLGITAVWASNVLTVTRASIVPNLDLTPYGYTVVSALFAWTLFRSKLFDVMPAAHDAVIKGMTDAVVVLDDSQRVIDLNPAAEKLLGLQASAVIGQAAQSVLNEVPELLTSATSVAASTTAAVGMTMPAKNQADSWHELVLTRNGQQNFFDQRISALTDRSGLVVGQVLLLHNVSELKRAEAAARQYADELEQRNRALDAFGHTIAHDLNNPLATLSGYVALLEELPEVAESAAAQEYLEVLTRTTEKMHEMVKELFQLASVQDVGTVLETVDMQAVARAAAERLRMDREKRGVMIEIEDGLPPAIGQALWLEEVFVNLIGNAIKYIGKENPAPRVRVRGQFDAASGLARYEVIDNGLGIDQTQQARLFEMFARFHRNEASGLGLGLSIVMRIVKRLNGQVGVESESGKGSTFWFTLPTPSPIAASSPIPSGVSASVG